MVSGDFCKHDWPGSGCEECKQERFVARRDRLLREKQIELNDFIELTQLLTAFSEEHPLIVHQSTYDRMVAIGIFEIDPRLEKFVRIGYQKITVDDIEKMHRLVYCYDQPQTKQERPVRRGPWPPQHPRSTRKGFKPVKKYPIK